MGKCAMPHRWSWESQSPAGKHSKEASSHRINNTLQDKGGDWISPCYNVGDQVAAEWWCLSYFG